MWVRRSAGADQRPPPPPPPRQLLGNSLLHSRAVFCPQGDGTSMGVKTVTPPHTLVSRQHSPCAHATG